MRAASSEAAPESEGSYASVDSLRKPRRERTVHGADGRLPGAHGSSARTAACQIGVERPHP
jgi:hypothetical protein